METPDTLLDALIPFVGSLLLRNRQERVARLRRCEAEAAGIRARRREEGLPAPPLAFLSCTSTSAFALCDCATSLHGWSIDVPLPLTNSVLSEAERAGVFFVALTGRGRWLDDVLLDILRVHDRQIVLLCIHPGDLGEGAAERLAELPHVLPLLETRKAAAGCCDGPLIPSTRGTLDALRSRRVPFGFVVTASERDLSRLMGIEFYNECLQENAMFGLVVDCLQIPSCDESCRPVRPADRAALGRHVGDLRGRLGGFFAYFPWDLAASGWCLAAPHQLEVGSMNGPAFTLLHVAPPVLGDGVRVPRAGRLFESLRISRMGEPRRPPSGRGWDPTWCAPSTRPRCWDRA